MDETPAGWYPDATDSRLQRYWDGSAWTEHTHPRDDKAAKKLKKEEIRASEARARDARLQEKLRAIVAEGEAYRASLPFPAETQIVGGRPSDKAVAAIVAHSAEGEHPWFILAPSGFGGVLAAWDDRLMIIKTGALTGFMTGALGGGRMTTFPFSQVTGVEFNGQMVSGVLEVLTPSYQGSANKDFWRGTTKSRNADANDPFTLSNTLPLTRSLYNEALPQLNELRRRIGEAHTPKVTVVAPAGGGSSLADELTKLAQLREAGVLAEDEFAAAKARLLAT